MITLRHKIVLLAMLSIQLSVFGQDLSQAEKEQVNEKDLRLAIRVKAPVDSVWARISTKKGMEKFFAPEIIFSPEVLSLFEVHFAPAAPIGQKGAENNRVLAIEGRKMISFTWDAPPMFPAMRKNRTSVAIRIYATSDNGSLVVLSQTGWGQGNDWMALRDYFEKAWGGFVLPNLKYSLEVGPIDWRDFPKNAPQNLRPAQKL